LVKRALTVATAAAVAIFPFLVAGPASAADGKATIHGLGHPDAIEGSYVVVYRAAAPKGLDLTRGVSFAASRKFGSAVRGFAARMDERQAKRLAAHPDVAIVEQDRVVRLDAPVPVKTGKELEAGRLTGPVTPFGPPMIPPPMGLGVKAYVIDTGILTTHTSLAGPVPPVWGTNTAGGPNSDCNGHGTHVAGILGGSFNERWSSPKAQLVAVKVLDCNGSGTIAGVVAGVDWVTANRTGPSIANMSLGGSASASLDLAVNNSIASGITYIVAAGNSNANACNASPAKVTDAITVGAVHGLGRRAWFSNYGTCVDLFSQGVGMRSAWHTSTTATAYLSGTSMAAPHVAAMASNFLSANLSATPAQVRAHVISGAYSGVIDPGPGSPNLMRIAYLDPFPSPPASVFAFCDSYWNGLICDASASGTVTDYTWFIDGYPAASGASFSTGCTQNIIHQVRVIAGNSGGAAENTTSIRCNGNPPV
jgi:hypothetical protein